MKILIAPDSFKGSLSSLDVGKCIENGILKVLSDVETEVVSVADGGEGSLEMISQGLKRHNVLASDPLGRPVSSFFVSDNDTAYIEMAQTSGLTLLTDEERNPIQTSTFGLGQQILDAVHLGFDNIVIFAGGSATNDAGLGALSALGFKFFDKNDWQIKPSGGALKDIFRFEWPERPIGAKIKIATDVTNPFYGPSGATYVYAHQKGAADWMLEDLENGIKNVASLFPETDIQSVAGSGAAGGLAGGFHLFLSAEVCSATDILFEKTRFAQKVKQSDIVITGEGKIDNQSLSGKLISRVLDLGVPTILIAGEIVQPMSRDNLILQLSLKSAEISTEESMARVKELLIHKAEDVGVFLKGL